MDKDKLFGASIPEEAVEIIPERRTALAFEISEGRLEPSEEEPISDRIPAEQENPVQEDPTPAPEQTPVARVKPASPKTQDKDIPEEFSIPDSFLESERNSKFTGFEDSFRIRTTYMPKFTEVSENYRMASPKDKPVATERPTVISSAGQQDPPAEQAPILAPTSEELEGKEVNHVVVTQAPLVSNEPKDESVRFFKFDGDDANLPRPEEQPPAPEEQQIQGEQISEEQISEEQAPPDEPKKPKDPSEYDIPDPVSRVREVSIEEEEEDPYAPVATISGSDRVLRGEFASPAQRDGFKDRFLDSIIGARVRLVSAVMLVLCALALEALPMFGIDVLARIGITQSFGRAVVAFILSSAATLIALPELGAAFGYLVKRKLHPELYLLISYAATLGYTATVCIRGSVDYPTFASVYCLGAYAVILAGYYRSIADFRGFKVISAKELHKTVLDRRLTRDLPRENLALDGAVDEYRSVTVRPIKANFISDYFARSSVSAEDSSDTVIMTVLGLLLGAVSAVAAYFLYSSVTTAVSYGVTIGASAVPLLTFVSHKLTFRFLGRELESDGGAFIGESSVYSIAGSDVITYADTEIFGKEDVSLKKVHLYGQGENMDKAVRQMCALFSVIGGPLEHHFSASMGRKVTPVANPIVEVDGISGILDGHSVSAGTEEYMRRHGIIIPADDVRTNAGGADSTRIMYGSEDGRVYVKLFIRYSFSEEFSMLMPYYKKYGIIPLIYTSDPNLDNGFLKTLTMGEDLIRVMKQSDPTEREEKVYRRASAEAVTLGGRSSVVNMLLLSKRYIAFRRGISSLAFVAMAMSFLLGIALCGVHVLGVYIPSVELRSLLPFGIQLLFLLIGYLATRRRFRRRGEDNK